MSRNAWQGFALPILLFGLSPAAPAQDAASVLRSAAEALQIGEVAGLTVVAAGSGYDKRAEPPSAQPAANRAAGAPAAPAAGAGIDPSSPLYVPPPPPPPRSYYRIASQVIDLDLSAGTLRIEHARAPSAGNAQPGAPQATTIGPRAAWTERHRYWLTPHGFVSGALERDATLGTENVDGVEYRVVSFSVDGGEAVRGYFNDADQLVRVRTTVATAGGEQDVVESFFDWREEDGISFPSTLIRKENGELAEVLIVQELDVRTAG